jgi:GNAT superfamily N-acetyltransferase
MNKLHQPAFAMEGIQLRPMQAADETIFRKLYAEVRALELRDADWPDTEKKSFCDSQYTLQDQHYRKHFADFEPWAICQNDAVIGRLYLATFDGLLILMDITMATSHRGMGIGSTILADVIRQADLQGREMRLHVEPDNPARGLYARLGFVEMEKGDIYLEMRRLPARC